jgi:hypothetical protein
MGVYFCRRWLVDAGAALLLAGVFLAGEGEGSGVDAVAEAGGVGSVGEYMAEVAAAFGAGNFDAVHAVRVVLVFVNGSGFRGDYEAGPSAAGVELGAGEEEKRSTASAVVVSCFVILSESAGEGALGAFFAKDVVLLGCERFAPFGFSAF